MIKNVWRAVRSSCSLDTPMETSAKLNLRFPTEQAIDVREIYQSRELNRFLFWRDIKIRCKQAVLGGLLAVDGWGCLNTSRQSWSLRFFSLGWHPNAWPVMPAVGLFRTRILEHFHKLSLDAGQ